MRRIRIAAVSVMVAAGFVGAVAAPASAERSANYGGCVSSGNEEPSEEGASGPLNLQADAASGGTGGNVLNAFFNSDGASRFGGQTACLPV
jgi:ABC-type oligopeptide transport system substrate-binding subunit